jgi:hypothetical protein
MQPDKTSVDLKRRKCLSLVGVGIVGSIAGCAGDNGENGDNGDGDVEEGPEDEGDDEPEDENGEPDEDASEDEVEEAEEELDEEELEEEAEEEIEELEEEDAEEDDGAEGSISVRIEYEGEWSGAVGSEGSTRSVDGSGPEEIELEGDPSVVSANAQKQDDSADELTVQILQDGEIIAEESTTAAYGVASVSESFF